MRRELPSQPNLDQLRIQAKELRKAHHLANPEALQRIRESHPRLTQATDEQLRAAPFRLSDAQLVLAREYGFASWPKLKAHIEALEFESNDPMTLFHNAFKADNAAAVRRLLARFPEFKAKVNEPVPDCGGPIITVARSREMLDVLVEAGADINAKSNWWAGGFGLLHSAKPDLARHAIARGAKVDAHAAARLGLMEELCALVSARPEVVNERGGDGQTPLHFASTVEIAAYLLDHGADIDARDVDHESTPAQYMTGDRRDVARYLIRRGCRTDILMATALGDAELVRAHLDRDPESIRMQVSDEHFPMVGGKAGGTIYQWTLGWYVSAHQVAKKFGHDEIFRLLMERSPADVAFIAALWLGDEARIGSIRAAHPDIVSTLTPADRRHLAHAARNNDTAAAKRMLAAGLPVDSRSQHGATPLHWAAWHGNIELVRTILDHRPPLEDKQNDFEGTPLRWAVHGSMNGWYRKTGDYGATVTALLQAGAKPPEKLDGTETVREVLRRHGVSK
ncbi:MAG: ankyrin repeat domain-containing protein [Verrucomicrobia subdivision 3 bacterium]|nr:ankyrin repeat domain-containing protein [Limisphaerales bacterium]